MKNNNLAVWNKVSQAPSHFLKEIKFGYLKGKSDISPQWRLMAMTQAYGQVGHGWTYRIVRLWSEAAADGNVMAFAEVAVKTKVDGEWGEEFWGIGGSTIVDKNKNGIQANDEGYKKATTDALGVAFKAVGVAADVYLGNFDGSKYLYDYSAAYNEPVPAPKKPLDPSREQAAIDTMNTNPDWNLQRVKDTFALTDKQVATFEKAAKDYLDNHGDAALNAIDKTEVA